MARRWLDVPIAQVTLIEENALFCKASLGLPGGWYAREECLCPHAILEDGPLVIHDLATHSSYYDAPALLNHEVRFYMGIPLRDENGLPLGALCFMDREPRHPSPGWIASALDLAAIARDQLTLARALRRAEEANSTLERSQSRYESLVASVPGVVYRLVDDADAGFRFLFASDGVHDLLGYAPREFLPFAAAGGAVFHPNDAIDLREHLRRAEPEGVPVAWQGRVLARNGKCRWVHLTARPEIVAEGETVWSGIMTDISPLKTAEEEILDANRTLESRVRERSADIKRAHAEMLMRLGLAAEARDDDTGAHVSRVARTSGILARGYGWSKAECEMIRQAAPMHDLGKLSIPDAILLKPGPLTPEERAIVERHTIEGARMLEDGTMPLVRMAETIARSHHERWDGAGYPDRLAGEAIPLAGRIVAIADVFDALVSERPYKRAWSVEDAVREIRNGAGTQFDPHLIAVFERCLGEILGDAEEAIYLLAA